MRTLYQFPLSHFCEKARWLLDYKELDFVAQNLVPGVHRAFAQIKTGQNKLPILRDQDRFISGTTNIALYLDETYPEHALLRAQPHLYHQALEIDELSQELGKHVRRWGLAHFLESSEEPLDILLGEQGYLRQFQKYTKPLLKNLMSKAYQLQPEQVQASQENMDRIIKQLNQRLIEQGGRYLVGDRLGLADIAVCSMLAPLLQMSETPWEKSDQSQLLPAFHDYQHQLQALPLGQYVIRIYRNERHARVDWRGV